MKRFYENHVRDQMFPALALRKAQLWLRDLRKGEIFVQLGSCLGGEVASQETLRMAEEAVQIIASILYGGNSESSHTDIRHVADVA